MKLSQKALLLFGPLTVLVEIMGLMLSLHYLKKFNPDTALSMYSVAPRPLPLIFGLTLTLAGILYFIFSLALRPYSKNIPIIALFSGIMISLTGWISFSHNGSTRDILHNFCIYVALAGYSSMIWLMKKHPVRAIQRISSITFYLLFVSILWASVCILILNRYIAIAQLLVLLIMQLWTIVIAWHTKKHITSTASGN